MVMKCELCHNAEAETAIVRTENGEESELYVCRSCAKAEKATRQKKSQRTRKVTGLPPGMSISISGNTDEVPPFIGSIINAVNGMVSDLEKAEAAARGERRRKRSRVCRARLQLRPLSSYRVQPSGRAARDASRNLERQSEAAVAVQLHVQHQYPDELLAG
jgi:hypothetical protein